MKFSIRKSVKGYMKDIKSEFKKGQVLKHILEKCDIATVEEVKKANPEFLKAATDYIRLAERLVKQGYEPKQYGIVEDSSEERKALNKAFTMDTLEKVNLFRPAWYFVGEEIFIYHLVEAVFDASLLIEQGAARKFEELVDLYKTFTRVEENPKLTFAWYGKTVLLLDGEKGRVLMANNRVIRDKISRFGIKGIKPVKECGKKYYMLQLGNGENIPLMKEGRLTSGMWRIERILKDHSKQYFQVHLQDREETGRPCVQFPAHTLLLLARYGLNAIKHTILKDGLITCDHVNMQGNDNVMVNLQLVSRRDNCLRARAKDPEIKRIVRLYDLGEFWNFIEKSYNIEKGDLKIKMEGHKEFWNKMFENHSVDAILAA